MKSIGIVRRIDELGRIVIPKELRKKFNIKDGESVEIFTDDGNLIVLKKYEPGCVFCESIHDVTFFENQRVCRECIDRLKDMD